MTYVGTADNNGEEVEQPLSWYNQDDVDLTKQRTLKTFSHLPGFGIGVTPSKQTRSTP